ncbi:MAG: hypothetical protein D6696_09685 [Acidobacteria bacterium]|nr:MAG: hypothetical protein D6696_09685 [Acidobacteriota bacterium]
MNAYRAIAHGLRRAAGAPALVLLLWLANLLVALPAAWVVADALEADVGASRFHHSLRAGFDTAWYAEYRLRARGLAATFEPSRTGKGVVYENLDAFFGGDLFAGSPAVAGIAVLYGLLFVFLQGGALAHFSAPRARFNPRRFIADGGRFYGRLLQLALIGLAIYFAIYRLARWLFGRLDESFRDGGSEQRIFVATVIGGLLLIAALNLVRLVFDYAKVATVADDQPLSVVALWQGLRFVAARPLRTAGVYAGVGLLSLLLLALYARLAPAAGQSTLLAVAAAFAFSQLFVAARLFLRLSLLGAELEVYRRSGGV